MSTPTVTKTATVDARGGQGVSFMRLVAVELRKLFDTRSGRWLHLGVAVLSAAAMLATFALPEASVTGTRLLATGGAVAAILLPVTAILALTTEWTQGSVVSTFVLVSTRSRVIQAKLAALLITTTAFAALLLALAAAGSALARATMSEPAGAWDVDLAHAGSLWLGLALSMLMGAAFGGMFMNAAVAIVTYMVLPFAWSIIGQLVEKARDAAQWLDTSATYSLLLDGSVDSTRDWQRIAVATAIWVLIPLIVGFLRLHRREIR